MGREMGGGSCFGTHVRIKDFKIKKKLKRNLAHVLDLVPDTRDMKINKQST